MGVWKSKERNFHLLWTSLQFPSFRIWAGPQRDAEKKSEEIIQPAIGSGIQKELHAQLHDWNCPKKTAFRSFE